MKVRLTQMCVPGHPRSAYGYRGHPSVWGCTQESTASSGVQGNCHKEGTAKTVTVLLLWSQYLVAHFRKILRVESCL